MSKEVKRELSNTKAWKNDIKDQNGEKIGQEKGFVKKNADGSVEKKSFAHASKKTKDGSFEITSESYEYHSEG